MSADNTAASNSLKVTHRYSWSNEEIIILSVLTLGIIGMVVTAFMGLVAWSIAIPIAVILAVLDGLLFHVGYGRKNNSQLFATIDENNVLKVEGNRLVQPNALNLDEVRVVGYKFDEPNHIFRLNTGDEDNNKSVLVPFRVAIKQPLADRLQEVFARPEVKLSAEAAELNEQLSEHKK